MHCERDEHAFRHREAEKDNRQRRLIVNVVIVFLLIGGLVGFLTGRTLT